jgi:hypothetical protein
LCEIEANLADGPLAVATANAHAVDHVALLGLEAHAAGLVGPARVLQADQAGQLAVLPAAHAEEEAEHIALLLPPQLLKVLQKARRRGSDNCSEVGHHTTENMIKAYVTNCR